MIKMGWDLLMNPHKPWVQLIKSKYLREKRFLDIEQSLARASWIGEEFGPIEMY